MKHIIVIETADPPDGRPIPPELERILLRAVEIGVEEEHGACYVHGKFNQYSAIAAVHEMYGAPKWDPNLSE